jgi:hypothetical protein
VLESGGELRFDEPLDATFTTAAKQLHIVATIEVPGDARLQAALAIADAQARAELVKSVRVGIATAFTEHSEKRGDAETQAVTRATAEVASGVLPALPPPQHGWRRVERNGVVVLEIRARLTADRAAVIEALHRAFKDEPEGTSLAVRAAALIGTPKESP